MNTRYYMVIIKGEIKTSEIMSCVYNRNTQKWDVKFNTGKTYSYAYLNVEKLTDPDVLNPNMYRISREGREFFDIKAIYVFRSNYESYWHICFGDGSERDYRRSDLRIIESCLNQSQSSNVFEYIKQIAGLSNLRNEETGEKLLSKRFDKISFVGSDVALAKYLNPLSLQGKRAGHEYIPIFPFGCNNSQYKAVKNAMENQISVIQGPPGTGKTQTILNIIANILMQGKTVQIVSNNNSATENVYEKLSSSKYNLGFVAATLGSSKNKKIFVEHQDTNYPDFSLWKINENSYDLQKRIAGQSSQLKTVFDKQEKLACLRQELSQLVTEQEYFNQYVEESDVNTDTIKFKKKLSSKHWMVLWQECQLISEEKTLLNDGFEEVEKMLQIESGSIGQRIALKRKELESAVEKVKEIVHPYVDGLDESVIDLLIQRKSSLKGFISDSGRVANVEKVVKYLATAEYAPETEGNNLVIDIQRVLSGLVKNIENQEFDNLYIKHKYEKVEELYGEDIKNMMKQMTVETLKKKFKYLEKVVWEKENTEIHEIKREMKDLIVRKEKVTRIRQQLNELSKVYDKSVEDYKNITLKQLRVPLLIYTGKILQDYQNGLGVFVSKDEMRFVSNGDAKHDILNTFSSGQLSGFVLAFLFAMNKQYIKASSDDIGFILIDDPVQTMDDINISSLIEVLRNDFSDKQIILSTHEMDKENYILYKFYKYNKVGQSFNVKEEIYG